MFCFVFLIVFFCPFFFLNKKKKKIPFVDLLPPTKDKWLLFKAVGWRLCYSAFLTGIHAKCL